jgi:CTP synthase (UTP-ammonia lyase)
MQIAIAGDRNPASITHRATDAAFAALGAEARWLPTPSLRADPGQLAGHGGVLVAPGSPYASMDGALEAIRYAREHGLPLLGTCGGFQHVVVEIARNVLGIAAADHAETNPGAADLVVMPLACSLAGQRQPVVIERGTVAHALYGVE